MSAGLARDQLLSDGKTSSKDNGQADSFKIFPICVCVMSTEVKANALITYCNPDLAQLIFIFPPDNPMKQK